MPFCDPFKQNLKRHAALDFIGDFADLSENRWFLGVGKPSPWTDADGGSDTTPPVAVDAVKTDTNFWRGLLGAKRIGKDDISLVVPRYDWVAGTVYRSYRDDEDLFDDTVPANFFVLVDEERVYKCIDNYYDAVSIIPPTHTDASIRTMSDGYRWKFMYQIPESKRKFLTKTYSTDSTDIATITRQGYIPIEYVDYLKLNDERTLQFSVQQAAVDGEISFTLFNNEYRGLLVTDDKCILSGATVVFVRVHSDKTDVYISSSSIRSAEGFYEGMTLSIEGGVLAGSRRRIVSYQYDTEQNAGVFTLDGGFSQYQYSEESESQDYDLNSPACRIVPTIAIDGDGRRGSTPANPYINSADVSVRFGATAPGLSSCGINQFSNYVSSFEMADGGQDYTFASFSVLAGLTFLDNTIGLNINNIGTPIMSPKGGHGSNATFELGAAAVMVVKDFAQGENGRLTVENDYRQIGIVKNPELYNTLYQIVLAEKGVSGSFVAGFTASQGFTGINGVTGFDLASANITEWLPGWSGTGNYASSQVTVNSLTGGEFGPYGMMISSAGTTFGIVSVEEITKAGEEGRFIKRLEIVSNPSTVFSGNEFYRGQYAQGVGNQDFNIPSSHAIGRIHSYSLIPGTNTRAYLLVEGNDDFRVDERVVPCDYYLTPLGSVTGSPRISAIDETYQGGESLYRSTMKMVLDSGGAASFDETTFTNDAIFQAENATGIIVDWVPGSGGATGSVVLSSVNGSFAVGLTTNYTYEEELFSATITGVSYYPDLKYHSGEVSYIQNIKPIERNDEQREEIKLLITF